MDGSEPLAPAHRNAPEAHFTRVITRYLKGERNDWLLFGVPQRTVKATGSRGAALKIYYFAPGARFALALWTRNAYGTVRWRCLIGEALGAHESGVTVPGVYPAARVLLQTRGAAASRLVLAWLKVLEAEGEDLLTCPRERFEAAHFRLLGSRADRLTARALSGRL